MPRWARYVYVGATALVLVVALGVWRPSPEEVDARSKGNSAPRFEVDPFWPKPFPNRWQIGQVGGIAVDSRDHIWIIQRQRTLTEDEAGAEQDPPRSDCCRYAPAVMEFDSRGNFIQGWGGPFDPDFLESRCVEPTCQWPSGEHGIFVDHNDFVWIAGNGNSPTGEGDHMVLKFTRRGDFVLQIGARSMTAGRRSSTTRTARTTTSGSSSGCPARSSTGSAATAGTPASSTGSTTWPSTRRATSTPPRSTPGSGRRSSCRRVASGTTRH